MTTLSHLRRSALRLPEVEEGTRFLGANKMPVMRRIECSAHCTHQSRL